jgi:Putative addiction module component
MNLQYLQDNNGNTTAVVVPIEEWNRFTEKYNDLEELPQWQKNIIDQRLDLIKNHPDELLPLEDFMKELDTNETF